MNPYLEQEGVFHDFHQTCVPFIREALVGPLRASYVVKLEEYLFIHELPAEQRRIIGRADVSISPARPTSAPPRSGAVATPPVRRRLPIATDTERHSYLEIRDREGMKLVTVIELLSPSNKRPGSDREQYLSKREELFRGGVHLVEIDLLRGWPRLPVEDFPACDYCVLVSRARSGRKSISGRSNCASGCRPSPFPFALRTHQSTSIYKRFCTGSTIRQDMRHRSTRAPRSRRLFRRMSSGAARFFQCNGNHVSVGALFAPAESNSPGTAL